MKFQIDPKIFEKHQDLKIGLIIIKDINNNRRVSAVESLLRGISAQKGKEFKNKDIDAEMRVKVWNKAYLDFDINPHKYQPSVRSLLTRVQEGNEIPHINPIVDVINYYSLKYLLPIGSEDLDWLCGDLNLTYAKGKEPFRAINSIDVEQSEEGEIAYLDDGGITCRYWNHRECERSKIGPKSTNIGIFIEDLSKIGTDDFTKILTEIADSIQKYIGGDISINILTEENAEADLGIEGRKNADDSKISAQEKAYYQAILKKRENNGPKIKSSLIEAPKPVKKVKIDTSKLNLCDKDTYKEQIRSLVEQALLKTFTSPPSAKVEIDYPNQAENGDYSCNIAMRLAKELQRAPQDLAREISENISKEDYIEKIEIADPGFINFYLNPKSLESKLTTVLEEKDKFGRSTMGEDKTILIDYSSPNIAKPPGIHHILSTILGQSIYNLYDYLGFNTVSINHIGDWGTQFGKMIYAYKKWGDKKTIENDTINELLKLYVQFHDEAEKTPEIEDDARKEFKIFEQGDRENRKLWKWFVDASLKDFDKTYERLHGIHFDYTQGESFYEDKLEETLIEGKQRGIFEEGEEGAFVVKYDDPNTPPFLVQKKDGATLYSTRDFAALKYRINHWHPLKILYVIDVAQTLNFKQLFEGATRFPWYHGEGVHVSFGRMNFEDSSFSTRKGNIILLNDVLDEATARALKIVEEKSPDLENKEEIAEAIGVGAVKYNILHQNRTTNITFAWDKMLSLEGNSGPYLQYTYARARSIIRKAQEESDKEEEFSEDKVTAVLRLLPKFKETIINAAQEYKPNILSNYLYELAQAFNSFYNDVSVLRAPKEEKQRLLDLVDSTSQILKNGLNLLGIKTLEEM